MKPNTYVEDYKKQINKDHSKTIIFEDYFILVVKNSLSNGIMIHQKVFDDINSIDPKEILGENVILFHGQTQALKEVL